MAYRQFQVSWRAIDLPAPPVVPGGGTNVDFSGGFQPNCQTQLMPYPAAGVGCYTAVCVDCRASASVMTSGNATDPMSLTLPCRPAPGGKQYLDDDS